MKIFWKPYRVATCLYAMSHMMSTLSAATNTLPADIASRLDSYNVVWDTPSVSGSLESMPLGNGDITSNVWVEQNGDLMMYIGKSDNWSEATRLLKTGRVRISFTPNPFAGSDNYSQTLDLRKGEVEITAGTRKLPVNIKVWIDAENPVVNVQTDSKVPLEIACTSELLRPEAMTFIGGGDDPLSTSYRGLVDSPVKPHESADTFVSSPDRVRWYHRNESSFFKTILEKQNVGELADKYRDPYLHRTFGAVMIGSDMKPEGLSVLATEKPVKKNTIRIVALTAQTESADEWVRMVDEETEKVLSESLKKQYRKHCEWWNNFWNRSWVFLSGDETARRVTEGYILQRYMIACQSRGAYPVKFNGGSLTFDYKGQNGDFRNWGPGYWYQNCRLYYWPLTGSGDFDMKKPWFDMYMAMLPLQKEITRKYYGHDGAFFPETLNFFGGYIQDDWGWNNTGTASQTRWIRYHYEGALEMLAEMIDWYRHTGDSEFAKSYIVPFATQVIRFFDRHWSTVNGEYRFIPANSLEQFWDCLNPIDYIAALTYDIEELKRLPADIIGNELVAEWEGVLSKLPPLPKSADGKLLLPAEEFGIDRNFENPQCYVIWPFKLYGVTQPDYELALNTFNMRKFKTSNCWSQCAVQAARLGLSGEMAELLMHNAGAQDPSVRFPAFWNPGSDYVPDFDNGGVLAMAVQTMLVDNLGDSILVAQALPDGWEADFKLHAYGNTTVIGKAKGKKVESLDIFPASRATSVVYPEK